MAKIDINKLVVVDIETMCNIFTIYCKDVATGKEKHFILYDLPRYAGEAFYLYKFLRNCQRNGYSFITYNGIAFDMPVLTFFYEWCCEKQDPLYEFENTFIINELYKKATGLIGDQDNKPYVRESDLFLPTIDLFVQNHYNVPGKYTSLKWLEFTLRFSNIEEMPIPHDQPVEEHQIDDIIAYNRNDVLATHEFYTRIKHESELRLTMSEEYKRPLINASEPRMVREIFGKLLSEQMGITYKELRELKTIRKNVNFKDIIFPYVKFITPELQALLKSLQQITIDCNPHSQQKFSHSFNYNGLPIDLGLGGIHACTTSGVYTPNDDEFITDQDVVSFYPNLAIQNHIKPAHLGEAFNVIYKNIFEQRKLIPKKDPKNYVYKIILNSTYGLSSEINSYFYDKQFTYTITINGQLSLLMLAEALTLGIPGIKILQMNTDGLTYIYKKKYKPIVDKISSWWQATTNLSLEEAYYSKMVIQDVNNYIAVSMDGKVKKKGLFETELLYHKNHSNLIIPKALEQYFLNNVPVDLTIKQHTDIFDFCAAVKKKSNFALNLYKHLNGLEIVEEQQKVARFIVSNTENAGLLIKDFDDGRKVSVLANTLIEPLNKIVDTNAKNYKLNYDFYIKKCKDIIENITPSVTQTTLF